MATHFPAVLSSAPVGKPRKKKHERVSTAGEEDIFDDFMRNGAKDGGSCDIEMTDAGEASGTQQTAVSIGSTVDKSTLGYRPDVDGLRAVAVIAVILFHFDASWMPGGFVGVDVFFVISGFVVSGSLLRERHESAGAYLAAFYSRRLKRLSPALFAVVFITSVGMGRFIPTYAREIDDYYVSGQLALVGWANVHFANMPIGYFATGAAGLQFNPFTHCWSLGVEEQFYLIFPWLLLACYRNRVTASFGCARCALSPLGAILVMLVSVAASFGYSWWVTAAYPTAAYYQVSTPWLPTQD